MVGSTQEHTTKRRCEGGSGGIAPVEDGGALSREDAPRVEDRLRDLDTLLSDLADLHEELLEVLQRKLVAMRQNDVETIHACVAREGELAGRISNREGLRRRLVVLIGRDLGIDEEEARGLSIRQLAGRVGERQKLKLQVAGERLAALLKEVAKVNTVVGEFAGRMLEHYRAVFGQITQGIVQPPVYVRGSDRPQSVAAQVIDAVG